MLTTTTLTGMVAIRLMGKRIAKSKGAYKHFIEYLVSIMFANDGTLTACAVNANLPIITYKNLCLYIQITRAH